MKRLFAFILLVPFILCTGCLQKGHLLKLYVYDFEKETNYCFVKERVEEYNYVWSPDAKYIAFYRKHSGKYELSVFDSNSLLKLNIPEEIRKLNLKGGTMNWVDNSNLLIKIGSERDHNYLFNIKTDAVRKITDIEVGSYYDSQNDSKDDSENHALSYNDEVYKRIGVEFFESYYSKPKNFVIYNIEEHEGNMKYKTYFFDLKTGKRKFLFDGFDFEGSPDGTKIKYYAPKPGIHGFDASRSAKSNKLITFIYDLLTGYTTKLADISAGVYFSNDNKKVIYYEVPFTGTGDWVRID